MNRIPVKWINGYCKSRSLLGKNLDSQVFRDPQALAIQAFTVHGLLKVSGTWRPVSKQ